MEGVNKKTLLLLNKEAYQGFFWSATIEFWCNMGKNDKYKDNIIYFNNLSTNL